MSMDNDSGRHGNEDGQNAPNLEDLADEKNFGSAIAPVGETSPEVWSELPEEMRALLQPPRLEGAQRVLCVQPHPDDNEIGMGGTIAWLVERGAHVDYLTVTDGRLGTADPSVDPAQLASARHKEAKRSARLLGVEECRFLGYRDGTLSNVPTIAGAIAEIIRGGCYDTVFCPDPWSPYESHNDHVVVGRAVAQAAINASLARYPEDTGTSPAAVRAVGFYFTANPNTVIDVTDQQEKKLAAIALHQSQMTPELLQMYGAYFVLRGRTLTGSDRVGEGFKLLAPLHRHCFPEAAGL